MALERRVVLEEAVEAIEEVGEHVDRDEGQHGERERAHELDADVAAERPAGAGAGGAVIATLRRAGGRSSRSRSGPTRSGMDAEQRTLARRRGASATTPSAPKTMLGSQSPSQAGTVPCSAKP